MEKYSKSWKPATGTPGKASYGKLMNWPIGEQGEATSAVAAAILGSTLPVQVDNQVMQPIQSQSVMLKEAPEPQEPHTKMFVLKFNDMRVTGKIPGKGLSVIGKPLNQQSAETLPASRAPAAFRPLAAQ